MESTEDTRREEIRWGTTEEMGEEVGMQTESWRVGNDGFCTEGGAGLGTGLGAGWPGGKNNFGQLSTLTPKLRQGRRDEATVFHHH